MYAAIELVVLVSKGGVFYWPFFSSGTSSARRKEEIARLNKEFQAMANLKIGISGILHFLIETENYRMLSTQEYSWRESPIRSSRVCDRKDRTEV